MCSQCPRAAAEPSLCDSKRALGWDNDAGTNPCLFVSPLGLWGRALVTCLSHVRPCAAPEGTETFPRQTGGGIAQDLLSVLLSAGKSSLPQGVTPTCRNLGCSSDTSSSARGDTWQDKELVSSSCSQIIWGVWGRSLGCHK